MFQQWLSAFSLPCDLFRWVGNTANSLEHVLASHSLASADGGPVTGSPPDPHVSLVGALAVSGLYLFSVLVASFAQVSAKPKEMPRFKFFYNALQMIVCSYMAVEAVLCAIDSGYVFMACNSHVPVSSRISRLYCLFYFSKLLDFCDTALIVVGKKWEQLSFLHLLHHSGSFVMTALMLKVTNNIELLSTVGVNTFVHFLTYTYFFVASHLGHGSTVWWKRHVLRAELLQFFVLLVHLVVFPLSCNLKGEELDKATQRGRVAAIYWYSVQFALFTHFWWKRHGGKEHKQQKAKAG